MRRASPEPGRPALLIAHMLVWSACSEPSPKDSGTRTPPVRADTAVPNRPPSAPIVAIEPATPATGDDLRYRLVTPPFDPDGDPLELTIQWALDGTVAPDHTDQVPADVTAKGQVWELRATASDGTFTSDTALEVVVIGNTPPTASVALSPSAPTTLDTLRATPRGSDVDDDTLGYRIVWLVNGENTGMTGLDVSDVHTTAGETWSVVVTPTDPDGAGEPVTTSVVIQNSAPTVADLDILPREPGTEDTLTASFAGDDPDRSDILVPVYSWTVDGSPVSTDATLAPTFFRRGDEIGLSIALNDGTVEGPARFAAPLTIENTPPEALSADLTPPNPGPEDTVTCTAWGWTDPDGDAEGYQVAWTLDGTTGPAADHWHLETSGAVGGETLTCTIIPDDGIDTGSALTASTTVVAP